MGFITSILKMLIAPALATEIGRQYDKLYDDPKFKENQRTIQLNIRKLEKALEKTCKENPDQPKCKRFRDVYKPMKNDKFDWK